MNPSSSCSVEFLEHGRSGSVVYREPSGSLVFHWEFGGGDTVAMIQVEDVVAWKSGTPWSTHGRAEILRRVADEAIRRTAPGSRAVIDEGAGVITLRQAAQSPPRMTQAPRAPAGFSMVAWRSLRLKFALGVLVAAGLLGMVAWLKGRMLVIQPGKGSPVGLSVRTDAHIATLIQTLEPYTPSLNRDHSKDTQRVSLLLTPLDGSASRLIPIKGGLSVNQLSLARILGSDGRTLWFDAAGLGGIDLETGTMRAADAVRRGPAIREPLRSSTSPMGLKPEQYLAAGWLIGSNAWLGLHSAAEVKRDFSAKSRVKRVVAAEQSGGLRRFHRGTLDLDTGGTFHRVVSMVPLGSGEYLNAAFLRRDDQSEPIRLPDPDGALMIHTSVPGLKGTLVVARVDTDGRVLWQVDTGIDRFKLTQILPGDRSTGFVGTRPMAPGRVSEPLLVLVNHGTGAMTEASLWR